MWFIIDHQELIPIMCPKYVSIIFEWNSINLSFLDTPLNLKVSNLGEIFDFFIAKDEEAMTICIKICLLVTLLRAQVNQRLNKSSKTSKQRWNTDWKEKIKNSGPT